MNTGTIIKAVFGTTLIVFMLAFGLFLMGCGFKFWGYFDYIFAGLVIYFLCLYYFMREEDTK